jgi:hypothetical protein
MHCLRFGSMPLNLIYGLRLIVVAELLLLITIASSCLFNSCMRLCHSSESILRGLDREREM